MTHTEPAAAEPTIVHVAVAEDDGHIDVQVASTRAGAIHWLATRIPAHDWAAYYDSLDPSERGPMTRDRSGMSDEEVLDCYAGPAGPDEPGSWGNDAYHLSVLTQEVFTPGVTDRPTR